MRPPARLALGAVALIAIAIGPPGARAQGYAPGPRPTYAAPGTSYSSYYYAPQPRAAAPAPTYYVQPRAYYVQPRTTTTYYTVPRRRGLLRAPKFPVTNTNYRNYILVDPNNPHWTFDYDDWMAHNF
ncbi:MAG TPA: hypothetical protein VGH33_16245 [Isosphaeraceae bacterium]|jgi:hypothetical protein